MTYHFASLIHRVTETIQLLVNEMYRCGKLLFCCAPAYLCLCFCVFALNNPPMAIKPVTWGDMHQMLNLLTLREVMEAFFILYCVDALGRLNRGNMMTQGYTSPVATCPPPTHKD